MPPREHLNVPGTGKYTGKPTDLASIRALTLFHPTGKYQLTVVAVLFFRPAPVTHTVAAYWGATFPPWPRSSKPHDHRSSCCGFCLKILVVVYSSSPCSIPSFSSSPHRYPSLHNRLRRQCHPHATTSSSSLSFPSSSPTLLTNGPFSTFYSRHRCLLKYPPQHYSSPYMQRENIKTIEPTFLT
jgi:hypothetical protein